MSTTHHSARAEPASVSCALECTPGGRREARQEKQSRTVFNAHDQRNADVPENGTAARTRPNDEETRTANVRGCIGDVGEVPETSPDQVKNDHFPEIIPVPVLTPFRALPMCNL